MVGQGPLGWGPINKQLMYDSDDDDDDDDCDDDDCDDDDCDYYLTITIPEV